MEVESGGEGGGSDADLLPVGKAAEILGVHPNTLRLWGTKNRIKEVRVGARRDRRYQRSEVLRLKSQLEASASTDGSEADFMATTPPIADVFAAIARMDSVTKTFARNYASV